MSGFLRSQEGVRSPGTGSTDGWAPPYRCWEIELRFSAIATSAFSHWVISLVHFYFFKNPLSPMYLLVLFCISCILILCWMCSRQRFSSPEFNSEFNFLLGWSGQSQRCSQPMFLLLVLEPALCSVRAQCTPIQHFTPGSSDLVILPAGIFCPSDIHHYGPDSWPSSL